MRDNLQHEKFRLFFNVAQIRYYDEVWSIILVRVYSNSLNSYLDWQEYWNRSLHGEHHLLHAPCILQRLLHSMTKHLCLKQKLEDKISCAEHEETSLKQGLKYS